MSSNTLSKIAVTGATGFIGRHLIERLQQDGNIVYSIGRDMQPVECDIIYHLACPSTTQDIKSDPCKVMDTIMDVTRGAMQIDTSALFVNASSMGALTIDNSVQGCYNVAKRCMEHYLAHSNRPYLNYRLPSVYGPGVHNDTFIKRCIDGVAYFPAEPNKLHYIAHITEVVDALATLRAVDIEEITLGEIYEQFNSGRRGLHRPTSST